MSGPILPPGKGGAGSVAKFSRINAMDALVKQLENRRRV
ncbi:MAG: hypothetical protein ACJA06_001848 [Halocynthiibacter sp.]|jgi:hypothetical protein